MESAKNICLGIVHGVWDSISGMSLVLHIDYEIQRLKEKNEEERRQRSFARQRRIQRSPSPTPSSAAAMARENKEILRAQLSRENPDERSLESIRRSSSIGNKQPCEKKIAKQVLQCCLLNGGFTWLSIVLFEQILLPTIKFVLTLCYGEHGEQDLNMIWSWLPAILSIIFGMMWVLPIFLLSKIVSSLWFADIANAAYRVRKGQPQMIPNISKLVADFLFSLLVQALFLAQSMLFNFLPIRYVGQFLCYGHLCLLYSLYSFEYKWFNMGWELHRRLSYIEFNWPYFMGFGLPLTLLTSINSSIIVNSCIFSIFFPLFILSGNEAKPLVGTTDFPLRIFSPVIFLSNLFFNRSSKNRVQKTTNASIKTVEHYQKRDYQEQHNFRNQERTERQLLNSPEGEHHEQEVYVEKPHRYQQPPPLSTIRTSHKTTTDSSSQSTLVRSEDHFGGGGMRPLIPTPIPNIRRATHSGTRGPPPGRYR